MLRLLSMLTVVVLVCAGTANAARLSHGIDLSPSAPVRQDFLGNETSLVRTESAEACVVSQTIEIRASRYSAPGTGDPVPFERITRSDAASVQIVAPREGAAFLRVQLKYSPRPDTPITLDLGDRSVDLRAMVEASGDSLRIEDPVLLAAIRARLEDDGDMRLVATSRDTGRLVEDRIAGFDFARFDACREGNGLDAIDRTIEPADAIAIAFDVERTDESRATEDDARICRVEDASVVLYRGILKHVEGFFSQTERVFVSFDDTGAVERVFIPGIVEGTRLRDGRFETRISIAANGNDPVAPARLSGCLGDDTVHLCEDEDGVLVECFGEFLSGELFEDGAFLTGFTMPASTFRPRTALPPTITATGGSGGFAGGFGGGGGRWGRSGGGGGGGYGGNGGGDTWGGENGGGGEEPSPPPIPLPASGVLLLGALGSALLVQRRRAQARR